MSDSLTHPVLAIDGGGTRCRIALDDSTVSTVITGPANVSTDFDGAVHAIVDGLRALSDRVGHEYSAILQAPAFVGLAGVTGQDIRDQLQVALPLAHMRIEDDRPAALRGALGDADGVIAHCGTGSFLAGQIEGSMRFAGGWGPVLGDEASAQWVGRLALSLTLQSFDGRLPGSTLASHLMDQHGGAAGIVAFAGAARPEAFGALAPLVTELAQQGDLLARRVMQAAADHIAESLPKVGWVAGQTICLTGGIAPQYAPYLPDQMQEQLAPPQAEPLAGALALARAFAREIADECR